MPRLHTELDLDVIYMVGNIISRSFQWNWFESQIHSESTGIIETSEHTESVRALRRRLLGYWPMYCVGPSGGRPLGLHQQP